MSFPGYDRQRGAAQWFTLGPEPPDPAAHGRQEACVALEDTFFLSQGHQGFLPKTLLEKRTAPLKTSLQTPPPTSPGPKVFLMPGPRCLLNSAPSFAPGRQSHPSLKVFVRTEPGTDAGWTRGGRGVDTWLAGCSHLGSGPAANHPGQVDTPGAAVLCPCPGPACASTATPRGPEAPGGHRSYLGQRQG